MIYQFTNNLHAISITACFILVLLLTLHLSVKGNSNIGVGSVISCDPLKLNEGNLFYMRL